MLQPCHALICEVWGVDACPVSYPLEGVYIAASSLQHPVRHVTTLTYESCQSDPFDHS